MYGTNELSISKTVERKIKAYGMNLNLDCRFIKATVTTWWLKLVARVSGIFYRTLSSSSRQSCLLQWLPYWRRQQSEVNTAARRHETSSQCSTICDRDSSCIHSFRDVRSSDGQEWRPRKGDVNEEKLKSRNDTPSKCFKSGNSGDRFRPFLW